MAHTIRRTLLVGDICTQSDASRASFQLSLAEEAIYWAAVLAGRTHGLYKPLETNSRLLITSMRLGLCLLSRTLCQAEHGSFR